MVSDLPHSIPYTTRVRQSTEEFAISLRISSQVLLKLNPHLEEMRDLIPGIPVNLPYDAYLNLEAKEAIAQTQKDWLPIDWAINEWKKCVRDYAGSADVNSEIEKYHAAASGVQPDEIGWCSSFVNWCVNKAGREGTSNKAARSWHDWGHPAQSSKRGDIAVFKNREKCWKGYVGFYWLDDTDSIQVLGGGRNGMIGISTYPKQGRAFSLLSVRQVEDYLK